LQRALDPGGDAEHLGGGEGQYLPQTDFLVDEQARAAGLGGRDRRAASHAERARLNATRAIRAAMANLARANPALGRHLAATVRTGRYCATARVHPGEWPQGRLGFAGRARHGGCGAALLGALVVIERRAVDPWCRRRC
jgi:hypothetical protein